MKSKLKLVTGYILYAGDTRRSVTQNNPTRTFGEVSRIVGNEWKKLSQAEKNVWEEKAQKINEETQATIEIGKNSTYTSFVGPTLPDFVWECLWNNCDFMFEDQIDCLEHAIGYGGHVPITFAGISTEVEYQCQWRACPRLKKNSPPFFSLHRLMRHVKEVHILKSVGRICPPSERSKHYVASKRVRNNSTNSAASSASVHIMHLKIKVSKSNRSGNMIG